MVCLHNVCPPPRSLLLALKRAVVEMLSFGSILTLCFWPFQSCEWSDFLQLFHITFNFFAFQHFFSYWTVSHPEDGSSTFLPNVRTSTTKPVTLKNLCVNLKTYMTTVAAISQIPISEGENTVLEDTRNERTVKSWHENVAWNWGAAQSMWLWPQECVAIEHWVLQDHEVCVVLCDLCLVQEDA